MITVRKFFLALIILVSATSASSDPIDSNQKAKEVIYKKSETHKFSGLRLKGEFKKPDLSYIYQRKGIRSEQIIDIPDDFNFQIREDANRF